MRSALIIANTEYTDPGLAQLTAPGKDAEDFARVLKDKEICAFDDVNILLNQPEHIVRRTIDDFFNQKKSDDLLVLYFSGHGVRDEIGSLYLAVKNTIRTRLRSTAIKSDYIREVMDQSRSKRQVVILDCCNSGAFPQGTKSDDVMGFTVALQGYGRFVLTASDTTQFAWEGDKIIGETDNSLFTYFLVKGLEGEADGDGDGKITVDELYDYAYDQISKVTPKQTPTKSASKVEGEIVLRQITRMEDIKPVSLPAELIDEIEDTRPYVREAAVQKLEKLLRAKNLGLARSAREALERIVSDENTTRRVAQAATLVLETIRQAEQKAEEERKATEETKQERVLHEKVANEKAERAAAINAARLAEKEAREKARSKPTSEISQATDVKTPTSKIRPSSTKFLFAGIMSVLGVLVLVLFRLGIGTVFPLFPTAPIEPKDIIPIALTFTLAPTNTPGLIATSTDIPTLTSLPCFKLLMPENGAVLQPTGNITFSWETMPSANKYRLEITMPDETVISRETDGLSINYLAESIPSAGTYRWRVVTYDANGAILCIAGPFNLTKPEYLSPNPTENNNSSNPNPITPRRVSSLTPTFTPTPIPSFTPTSVPTLTPTSVPSEFWNFGVISDTPGELRFTVEYFYNGDEGAILFSAGCLKNGQNTPCVVTSIDPWELGGWGRGRLAISLGLYGPDTMTTDQIIVSIYHRSGIGRVYYQTFNYIKSWIVVLPTPTMVR